MANPICVRDLAACALILQLLACFFYLPLERPALVDARPK
jgi:hypothetical protein